jgi:hypothetical protein
MAGFRRGASAGVILHDEAGVRFLSGPGRREAAGLGLVDHHTIGAPRGCKPRSLKAQAAAVLGHDADLR